MSQPTFTQVPLLGALCVAAGYVSQEDLDFCLALQRQTDNGTPIGQLLVLHNYLTQHQLARIVAQQQSFRRILAASLDARLGQSADEPAAAPDPPARATLPELSAFTAAELDDSPLFGELS